MAEKNNKEVLELWKSIDTFQKKIELDPEIIGEPDYKKIKDDNVIPAVLKPDDRNGLDIWGGANAQQIADIFEDQTEKIEERLKRYDLLERAIRHPEINGGLNIYADEAAAEDEDGNVIKVFSEDEKIKTLLETMLERIGAHENAWQIIKNMGGYGDDFYEVVINQSGKNILKLNPLNKRKIRRIEKRGRLQGFLPYNTQTDQNVFYYWRTTKEEEDQKMIYPWRVLHFKIGSSSYSRYGIYGEAIVDSVLDTIAKLQLMEKAMVIARITRAPERRVYNIDVGQLTGDKAIRYAREAVAMMKNKKTLDATNKSKLDNQSDIFGQTEDIVIPRRSDMQGNSIEVLPSANSLGDIADIEFLQNRITPAMGIPRSYLIDDSFQNANINLSSKSIHFAKRIKRIQRFFLYNMYKLAVIELRLNGFKDKDVINKFTLVMNNPSNIDETQKLELETARWNLITAIKGVGGPQESVPFYPDYLIYKEILRKSDEEIVEILKLNFLQASGSNPFNIKPEDERPPGSEDLEQGPPQAPGEPTEGGEGVPPEAENALGGTPPAEGGGGGELPASPDDLGEEIPEPENADTAQDVKDKISYVEEARVRALKVKQSIERRRYEEQMKSFERLSNIDKARKESEMKKEKMYRANSLLFLESNGEFSGLKSFAKSDFGAYLESVAMKSKKKKKKIIAD